MSPDSWTVNAPDARPEIAESWHRASLAGVDQAGSFDRLVPGDIDPGSSLLVGAAPVLDELEASLAGTGYSTILGDRECRVVRRWFDNPRTEAGFDTLNLREGVSVLEETIGTNALGTVFETRLAVTIHGDEHFVEALRRFSCYGHPIRHPLTRRIEGVLDVSALAETASPLLAPLIARAVHDIEQRLLGGSRSSEKSLLAAFQQASGHRKHAILAIGEDIVMSNQAASELLSPSDVALLRVLAEEPLHRDECALKLSLESGRPVTVTVTRVSGARRGALLRVEPCSAGPHLMPATIPGGPARPGRPADPGVRAARHRPHHAGPGAGPPAGEVPAPGGGPARGRGRVGPGLPGRDAPHRRVGLHRRHRSAPRRAARPGDPVRRLARAPAADLHLRAGGRAEGPRGHAGRYGQHPRGADAAVVPADRDPRAGRVHAALGGRQRLGPPDPRRDPGPDRARVARQPARAQGGHRGRRVVPLLRWHRPVRPAGAVPLHGAGASRWRPWTGPSAT